MLIDGVFENWKKELAESMGASRFLAKSRQEALEDLASQLADKKISYNEAEGLKRQLRSFLVTKKGLKGGGNHKNWAENVESDFVRILYTVYEERDMLPIPDVAVSNRTYAKIDFHPLIDIWGRERFKNAWSEDLKLLANTPDTSLHNLFLDEMF